MGKLLIIAGGGTKHLKPFEKNANKMGISLLVASFLDLSYLTKDSKTELFVKGVSVDEFRIIYIRLVGSRYEDLSLLVNFSKQKGIKIIDEIYAKSEFVRLPLVKSLESALLYKSDISTPKTFYGSLEKITGNAPGVFGYPFVIKGTTGKQGHEVWSPRNENELKILEDKLAPLEKEGKRFIAQEFIKAGQRIRVLVIGNRAVGAITRPTRWRRRFTNKEAIRKALIPIPENDAKLAIKACKALSINIAGVDIIHDDKTGKAYVLEVNSAPRWVSISSDTGLNVEREILKYLVAFCTLTP